MKGKLIVIEGTNSSGKSTQAKLLVEKLNNLGLKSILKSFPMYDSPTGKIIGECLLNKNGKGLFQDNLPPKVASLYYAADRAYNIDSIKELLNQGINVILDRYVESNMAYQASIYDNISDQINMLLWMEQLEFNLLDLPKADKVIFLYLPYQYRYLINKDNYEKVYAIKDDKLRSIDDINEEILSKVVYQFNGK